MSAIGLDKIPEKATGLKLHKIVQRGGKEELLANELVVFTEGRSAVNTVLRRAALAGRVEVDPEGDLPDFFADIYEGLNGDDGFNSCVALDAASYRALKTHWMRCRYEAAQP